jgi:MFS family permease
LFRERAFAAGVLIAFVFYMATPSFFMIFTYYLQRGLQWDAMRTALAFVPCSVGVTLAAVSSAMIQAKIGRAILVLGAALQLAGVGVMVFRFLFDGSIPPLELGVAMFTLGVGQGFTISPLASTVLSGIKGAHAGSASGILTTFQQLGGAIGVAIVGSLFASFLQFNEGYPNSIGKGLLFHVGLFLVIAVSAFLLPRVATSLPAKGGSK